MITIILDRGDHGFDGLFAHLLGALLRTLVEQPAGIRRFATRLGAGIDDGGQVMDRETGHQAVLGTGAHKTARARKRHFNSLVTRRRHGSSRIGRPARIMCSLAWRMVNSPKWKIEAASTAVARPSRIPSTRWSRLPTPPEAITGTGTLSAMARVKGRSKPCRVPSRSIDVSRISPAPSETTSW